jgi:hypothetical protein
MSRGGARFFAYGAPFVALVAVGASGLARVVGGRLEVRDALGEVSDARAPARTQRGDARWRDSTRRRSGDG